MVATMKGKGRAELKTLRRRVMTLAALGRVSRADCDFIVDHLDEVDNRIIRMEEKNVNDDNRDRTPF